MSKVIVIGGGAAGMMAAIFAARAGHQTIIFEKSEKLGKKVYITGKGRCNLTNACDLEELFRNVVTNSRFMYSAFYGFSNEETIAFFQSLGLQTKVERGQRVFPVSDHSSDVIKVLEQELRRRRVEIHLNTPVRELLTQDGRFAGVVLQNGSKVFADAGIVATGGLSYPTTGSTGDGHRFAKALGHTVTPCHPALVAVQLKSEYPKQLEGLALKNIEVSVTVDEVLEQEPTETLEPADKNGKAKRTKSKKRKLGAELYRDFGEMVFTAKGVSGPVVLSASSYMAPELKDYRFRLHIDLKPALSEEQLDARILRDFDEARNKQYKNALEHLLPQKLIRVIIELSGISPDKQVNAISREERKALVKLLKDLSFEVSGLGDYTEAIITKGGVQVKEINPSTMESKLVPGVYFAGEVLDVDALTGGFNLQVAWSSGWLAAQSIS
ncbi:MAG: NAD(P)/FAD-dependent oxidoreductase [Lachnospiraceae bacterium]|nr:NAD(P)/FAD-dependent oxidoreductase [Lachnospiraceae bacterium]